MQRSPLLQLPSNSTEHQARIFMFCFSDGPSFSASWRINWAGCYLLAHNVSRYTLGQTLHQCFQEFHKLTIKSNPQRISILCATLWKVFLRATDATSFCTSQNFLYWIKKKKKKTISGTWGTVFAHPSQEEKIRAEYQWKGLPGGLLTVCIPQC